MLDWIKEHKIYTILIGLGLLLGIFYLYSHPFQSSTPVSIENDMEWNDGEEKDTRSNDFNNDVTKDILMVDVKGAVEKPGVYEAILGERVVDIIDKAGGLKKNADEDSVNFALRVSDEMLLYIPAKGEVGKNGESGNALKPVVGMATEEGKVNLNKATETELQTLTGVGPAKAKAIIEYRETNGPFKKIEDLMSISGIGEKTFEKLKESITIH